MKVYRAAAFADKIGVHKNTVKSWSGSGKLSDRRPPAGHRHCTDADVDRHFGVKRKDGKGRRTVVYGRVSRRAQRDDLRSQQQAMETFCPGAGLAVDEWRTEIGGMNFQRPVFRTLMEWIEHRELGLLPVAHQDRLCRFGFDGFSYFAETHGCEIRVVNQPSLSPPADLVEDLMAVVHTFSCRPYGLRRYRKQIREAAVDG
ncbi:MAG: IS607 family transposase [Caldilineaceae bacterium SB0666_bin_21]|nr:IS607 family transposase [Caldilineaceae bacterium SB0666_bin_21]